MDKRKTEKLQSIKLPEVAGRGLLFGKLLDDALEHSKAENGDRSTHELKLKIERLRPEWGGRKARDITKQQIVAWLQSEASVRNWTAATMNRWQACFSLVFRVAVDNEKIQINPAARIKRKTENNQSVRFLTIEEEDSIRAELAKHYPTYLPTFLLSIHTGMRASEQWRVLWSDVDFDRRILTVRKLVNTKNGRHIRLNDEALGALRTLHAISGPRGPVFLNSKGTPMTSHREWFDPAVKMAGVENYSWHKNRHTTASRMAMAGGSIHEIAEALGHSTIQMSARYAHLSPDHMQSVFDRLVSFGRQGTPERTPPASDR